MHQHLLIHNQASARAVERGDLDLVVCRECGFIFNAAFEPSKLEYGPAYESSPISSPVFAAYVDDLVRDLVGERGVQHCRILEVGCGTGYFLRKLVAEGPGNMGIGFDPSYAGPPSAMDGRLQFRAEVFDPRKGGVLVDVVIGRHVIEHVPDPLAFLRAVRAATHGARRPRLFLETPDVEWILRHQVVWDFFYEHCSYFTSESLRAALALTGFHVTDVRRVFGAQYLWMEAAAGPADGTVPSTDPDRVVALCTAFTGAHPALMDAWATALRRAAGAGPLALWGAGAKGVTLANLMDPDRALIACVVDVNPRKQGGFLPGTGHPIVGPPALPAYGVRTVVLTNPMYREEIQALVRAAHLEITLVDPSEWRVAT